MRKNQEPMDAHQAPAQMRLNSPKCARNALKCAYGDENKLQWQPDAGPWAAGKARASPHPGTGWLQLPLGVTARQGQSSLSQTESDQIRPNQTDQTNTFFTLSPPGAQMTPPDF